MVSKKYKLIPEQNIKTDHEKTTNNVWPMSGWIISSKETKVIKIVDAKYLNKILVLFLHKIIARITIKKGFTISMGWNLGKKNKSIHLLDPLTSMPIIGTKNKESNEIKKRIIENLYNLSWFKDEKIKIKITPIIT